MESRALVIILSSCISFQLHSCNDVAPPPNSTDASDSFADDADNWKNYTEVACSFSPKGVCGYDIQNDITDQTRWTVEKFEQSGRYNRWNKGFEKFSMQQPPHGQYFIATGPTNVPESHGLFALIASPLIRVPDSEKCLHFLYHNRAPFAMIPTLEVRIRQSANASQETVLAEYFKTDTAKWFEARVPLPVGEYQVIFAGKNYFNGTTSGGLIAVTSVVILDGSCAITVLKEARLPGDCGFEDGTRMCGYRYSDDSTTRLLHIRTESLPPSEQQQQSQRQSPSDTFLAMTNRFYQITNHGSRARIQSPNLHIASEGCLYLSYFNNVESTTDEGNALNIFRRRQTGGEDEGLLFRLPIQKSYRNRWYQLTGALPAGRYRLVLEAVYSSEYGENAYVGLDNVEIFNRSCSDIESLPDACSTAAARMRSICFNGGTCASIGKKSFRCACAYGFYGDRCDFAVPCRDPRRACLNGGTCVNDGLTNSSCLCAGGFIGERCAEKKNCGSPSSLVEHARLKDQFVNSTFQSRVEFECLAGYIPTERVHAVCSSEGMWSLSGQCRLFDCGPPPPYPYNTRNYQQGGSLVISTNTTLNGLARYECGAGLVPYNGQDVLRCLVSSGYSWNGVFFQGHWRRTDGGDRVLCQPIPDCGNPTPVRNARLVSTTSQLLNGLATYECVDGFRLNPANVTGRMVCSSNARWTCVEAFQCWSLPDCGVPPDIAGGRVVALSNTTEFGVAKYRCDDGHRLDGILEASCNRIGSDPLEKVLDWLFVPRCVSTCAANVGRLGNASVVILEVAECQTTVFEEITPTLDCKSPASFAVRRKPWKNVRNHARKAVVFYGGDLCVGVPVRRVQRYRDKVVGDTTVCKSFCLQYPSDVHYVTIHEDIGYQKQGESIHYGRIVSTFERATVIINRKLLRYRIYSSGP